MKVNILYTTSHLVSCGICDEVQNHKSTYSKMLTLPILDAELKRLQSQGKEAKLKQVEIITEEDLLWQKCLLGKSTHKTLSSLPQLKIETVLLYSCSSFSRLLIVSELVLHPSLNLQS